MKMCEHILKKKTEPQYNSNSLNCKNNQEHRNIALLSLQLRSKTNINKFNSNTQFRFNEGE